MTDEPAGTRPPDTAGTGPGAAKPVDDTIRPGTLIAEARRIIWDAPEDEIAPWVASAIAGGSIPALLEEEDAILGEAPCERRDAIARLRDFATTLSRAREYRFQERVWRRTLALGIVAVNAWQRIFLAQVADERLAEAIETAGVLVKLAGVRPKVRRHIGDTVKRFVTESSDPGTAATYVRAHLGIRFAHAVLEAFPESSRTTELPVSKLVLETSSREEVLALASAVVRFAPDTARTLLERNLLRESASIEAGIGGVILAEAAGDTAAARRVLDRLGGREEPDDSSALPTLILWGAAAARADHASLAWIAARIAGDPAAVPTLWEMFFDRGLDGRTASRFLAAVEAAGADPLDMLDLSLAIGADLGETAADTAQALIETDPSSRRDERRVALLQAMLEASSLGETIAATYARRHAEALCSVPAGAAACGRALTIVQDWAGALRAWDRYLEAMPDAPWILAKAAYAATRIEDHARARDYILAVDREDPRAGPAFLMLAHVAFLAGEDATGMAFLDRVPAETEALDIYNISGRLRALMCGDATRLSRGAPVSQERAAPAAATTVLTIDPGFAQNSGHHSAYNKFAIQFFSRQLGVDPSAVGIFARRETEGFPIEPIDDDGVAASVHRVFDYNPYFFDEFPKTASSLSNLNRAWQSDLERGLHDLDLRAVRVVFFHSMKASMVLGLARWTAETFAGRDICIVIAVIEVDYLAEGEAVRRAVETIYGQAFAILSATPVIRIIICAETAPGCASLATVSGRLPIHHIPYLAAALAGPAEVAGTAFATDTVTIGLVGGSRADRGLDLFPEAIRTLADRRELRWILQFDRTVAERMNPLFPRYLDRAVADRICEWHEGRLGTDEYYDALRRMDVVLMPYRDRYAVSGSGVFYEAMQLQRYVVIPEATYMRDVVREFDYPATLLPSTSIESVLEAVESVLARKAELALLMRSFRTNPAPSTPLERFRALVDEACGRTAFDATTTNKSVHTA